MRKLLIATHNQHKLNELKILLQGLDFDILSLESIEDFEEVDETGSTFFENAYLKAYHFAKKHQILTLADDSGLVVDALDGKPGIYSARYSGKGDYENNLLILKQMSNEQNRIAHFACSLVLCYPNGEYRHYEGKTYGTIMTEMKGLNGFGYDVIFYYPPFKSGFAEISLADKNLISHRAKAYHQLKEDLF